jgi:hypothetical protein
MDYRVVKIVNHGISRIDQNATWTTARKIRNKTGPLDIAREPQNGGSTGESAMFPFIMMGKNRSYGTTHLERRPFNPLLNDTKP